MIEKIQWTTDPHVVRTIAEDSFGGWEKAIVEAVKNSVDSNTRNLRVDQKHGHHVLLPDSPTVPMRT